MKHTSRKIKYDVYLQVNHFPRHRSCRHLTGIQHRNASLPDLSLKEPQPPLHFVTSLDFTDKPALEGVDVGVKLKGRKCLVLYSGCGTLVKNQNYERGQKEDKKG